MATYNLFVDSDTKRIVSGFLSSQQAQQQQFVFGDKARVAVTVVTQNNGGDFADRPWRLIDMSDKRIDVAIRAAQKTPTVGNFKILASDDIAYNATADEVEVALNADPTISGEGGVTVSSIEDSTSYNITYNTTGTKTELSQTFNDLLPSSGVYIDTIREGDASTTKVVQIRTEVLPASYAQLSDTITQPQVVIEQIRNGGGGDAGEVQRVFVDSEPYSGTYALLVDGSPTGEIAYNDTQNEVTTALAKLPLIGGDESLITVNGDAEDFTVTFDPSLGDLSNIVVDSVNLTGLNGKQGDLDLNTIEMTQILAGEESVSGTLEIVLHDTLTSSDETIYQDNCSILEDVIGSSPPSVTPIREYADAQHTHVIADVDGLQDELDDLQGQIDDQTWELLPIDSVSVTDPPSSYPSNKFSVCTVGQAFLGWPTQFGHVETDARGALNSNYITQYFKSGQASNRGDIWTRSGEVGETWGAWLRLTGNLNKEENGELLGTTYTAPNLNPDGNPDSLITLKDVSAIPGVKAFCTFDGTLTGTNPPTSGYNVASVTRDAVGDYTVTFADPAPGGSFATIASTVSIGGSVNVSTGSRSLTGTSARVTVEDSSGTGIDITPISFVAFW